MTTDSTTTPDESKLTKLGRLVKFGLSSLSSTAIDAGLFALVYSIAISRLGDAATVAASIIATAAARVCSSFYNFNMNRAAVFKNKDSYGKALLRYYGLCIPQMCVSAGLVALINRLFENRETVYATIIKVCVDTVLFFISYTIQKKWVFKKDNPQK